MSSTGTAPTPEAAPAAGARGHPGPTFATAPSLAWQVTAEDLAEAREYAGHAALHVAVTRTAYETCA